MRAFHENLFLLRGRILSKIARAWPTPPAEAAQREINFPTRRTSVCIVPVTTITACTFFSSISEAHLSKRDRIRVSEAEALVDEVVTVLREQKRRGRWGFLRAMLGTSKITSEQAVKITIRLRSNPRLALRFFHWSEASSLCRHDLASYAAAIHVLARGRHRTAAISLIRSAIILVSNEPKEDVDDAAGRVFQALLDSYRSCDSTPLTFDLLVRLCLQARRFDRAMEIVQKLRNRCTFPSIFTCNELVRQILATRGTAAGFAVYEELFDELPDGRRISPNLQTFHALLMSLDGERRQEYGEKIRIEMEKHGCKKNSFTCSVLMSGLCEEGNLKAAEDLFLEMAEQGIERDATAYNAMISGFCFAGEMEKAEELFRDMTVEGIEPTSTTYDMLIVGHCATGDVSTAGHLFEEMRRRGFRPESSMIEKLVGKFSEKSRAAEGLRLLREEMAREGGFFVPSREIFRSLIEGFCREGNVKKALELQAEMAGKGFEPDSEICQAFVDEFLRRGDDRSASKLVDEMLERGLTPFRTTTGQ